MHESPASILKDASTPSSTDNKSSSTSHNKKKQYAYNIFGKRNPTSIDTKLQQQKVAVSLDRPRNKSPDSGGPHSAIGELVRFPLKQEHRRISSESSIEPVLSANSLNESPDGSRNKKGMRILSRFMTPRRTSHSAAFSSASASDLNCHSNMSSSFPVLSNNSLSNFDITRTSPSSLSRPTEHRKQYSVSSFAPSNSSLSIPDVKETEKLVRDYDPVTGNKMINNYMIIKELGRGVHGKVKLCVDVDIKTEWVKINKNITPFQYFQKGN